MLQNPTRKGIDNRCPKKSFGTYLKTVAANDSRFNILHLYHMQHPWVLGNLKEFDSVFSDLCRGYRYYNDTKWNRDPISLKGLEQALIAYGEYRLYYGV